MRPRIRDGEFAIIEPGHPVEPGDDVLVKARDGRVMVKTFLYRRAGKTHLVSINEAHPSISLTDVEIEKMHYVVAIARPSMYRQR
jgi:phage repressor protein C with HTH and peptisase S24 domain